MANKHSNAMFIRNRFAELLKPPEKKRARVQFSPTVKLKKEKSKLNILSFLNNSRNEAGEVSAVGQPEKKKRKKKDSDDWQRTNPLPESAPSVKFAHQVRLAVHMGNGIVNPEANPQLRNVLREIWELGLPEKEVHRIIKQCQLGSNKLNTYKLQLKYRRNIFLICCVQVGQLLKVKNQLKPILKKHGAQFHYVMNLFKNIGLIEASIKPPSPIDFENFDTMVRRDAYQCKARALEVINYGSGSVCFTCNPLNLLNVARNLKTKGYEIVFTENGYQANLLVDLNWVERSLYNKFVEELYGIQEITHIYDNLRLIDVPTDALTTE